jgi:hypothetical protein
MFANKEAPETRKKNDSRVSTLTQIMALQARRKKQFEGPTPTLEYKGEALLAQRTLA